MDRIPLNRMAEELGVTEAELLSMTIEELDARLKRWEREQPYPPALRKATIDPFDYALKLTTGEVVRFERAEFNGNWVTLTFGDMALNSGTGLPFPCPRGIDVRLDQIVWVADAPEGS